MSVFIANTAMSPGIALRINSLLVSFAAGVCTRGAWGEKTAFVLLAAENRVSHLNAAGRFRTGQVHLLVRPGLHLPVPAVQIPAARSARPSPGWPPLRRPPAGLGLDRPSTVLWWGEAVAKTGP